MFDDLKLHAVVLFHLLVFFLKKYVIVVIWAAMSRDI